MISRMLVVVPAADEQDEIGACLAALLRARARLHRRSPAAIATRIVVVLDACRDATAAVVARYEGIDTVVSTARCVGTARALGVAHGLRLMTPHHAGDLWLAGTDADSRVPSDWMVRMAEHADRGDDLVVGTVRPRGLSRRLDRRWRSAHEFRDGHNHVHGANLGIRASSYARLGGWRDLASHEDVDLVDRATADGGVRIRRSGGLTVSTSSRRHGRTPHGFAGYLRAMDNRSNPVPALLTTEGEPT